MSPPLVGPGLSFTPYFADLLKAQLDKRLDLSGCDQWKPTVDQKLRRYRLESFELVGNMLSSNVLTVLTNLEVAEPCVHRLMRTLHKCLHNYKASVEYRQSHFFGALSNRAGIPANDAFRLVISTVVAPPALVRTAVGKRKERAHEIGQS